MSFHICIINLCEEVSTIGQGYTINEKKYQRITHRDSNAVLWDNIKYQKNKFLLTQICYHDAGVIKRENISFGINKNSLFLRIF